jgi:hypothetical protein
LFPQLAFRGPYLLVPWHALGLPYVQIEASVEAHNFGTQTFAIRGRLSLWICTERSWCSGLREYLSGWVDLVSKPPSPRSFTCWYFGPWVIWSHVHFNFLTCDGLHDLLIKCLMNLSQKSTL